MLVGPTEIYRPRAVFDLGVWSAGDLRVKVYGLRAQERSVTDEMASTARGVLHKDVLPRVAAMGESNDLGFVIIHPGALGLSIAAHWWAQGCVLCQHFYRRLYDEAAAMDARDRPVVGCVWELAIVNAEQEAWRRTMMTPAPDPTAYLEARPRVDAA